MREGAQPDGGAVSSRGRFLRTAFAGGAVISGGAALGAGRRHAGAEASAAPHRDTEVLNLFLTLEYVQQAFYEQAVRSGRLTGPLREFAAAAAKQEAEHAAMLRKRLGRRADPRPTAGAGEALHSPEAFQSTSVDLEEAVLATFVGEAPNLSRAAIVPVATLVSVEARQAAWIRDLAGVIPAPRAADPARNPSAVLDELRAKGLLA